MPTSARPNQALRHTDCHEECGCREAACCFLCPLAVCRYDDIAGFQAEEYRLRWQRLTARARTLQAQGHHPRSIAIAMRITERTAYRYLAQ